MNMYNLIEYSEKCPKTSGSLWPYYRDQPALDSMLILLIFLLMMIPVFGAVLDSIRVQNFHQPHDSVGKNIIIFGVNVS